MTDFGMWILDGKDLDSGWWLAAYDPDAFNGAGDVQGTHDPADAMRFTGVAQVFEEWKRVSTVMPLRRDGKPNRPLSAFTIQPRALP